MPRCIFHIGHAKTGTTYLQHWMHLNAAQLWRHNIWVPTRLAHLGYHDLDDLARAGAQISGNLAPAHQLTTTGPGDDLPALCAYLFTPPKGGREHDILLSSELFFYYPDQLAVILRAAQAHNLTPEIIAYIDRQDQSAIASYLQYIRNHAYTGSVIEFLQHDDFIQYGNYLRAMDRLSTAAPGIKTTLRSYEKSFLHQHDLLADFLHAIGHPLPTEIFQLPSGNSNAGLQVEQYHLLQQANRKADTAAAERLRRIPMQQTEHSRSRVQAHYYTKEVKTFIDTNLIPGNRALLTRYMPHASAAERAYWQTTAPLADPIKLHDVNLQQLRRMAFR